MYARIRQKLAITNGSQTVTTTSLGNNALSLLIKDIGRLITGLVTSVNNLNSEIWDIPNSEVISSIGAGWSEYQTNFLTTSTNLTITTTLNDTNIIYLRAPAAMTSSTGGTVYKYSGLGIHNNSLTYAIIWNTCIPWGITDHTGNTTANYFLKESSTNPTSTANGRNSFQTNILTEYVIYATPRCLFVSSRLIGSSATQAQKVYMQLEYPETALSKIYNLPNQVFWEVSNGAGSTTTGTGASFNTGAYNTVGGAVPRVEGDLFNASAGNQNIGIVYTPYANAPTGGLNSIWSTAAGTADTSTLKPATYGSMSNTVNSSGTLITVPAMPLIHYPSWDSVYDLSTLTGVYATRSGLGATGDTLTVNGQNYAYVNATNMGYLIPRQ